MKQFNKILIIILFLSFLFSTTTLAEGDGNFTGGGSGIGTGTAKDYWSGADGIRATVIDALNGAIAATPVDFSSKSISSSIMHFGKVSKLQYKSGVALTLASGSYMYHKPGKTMPRIVSGSTKSSIKKIKKYFCSEFAVKMIAQETGISYNNLTSGQYKIIIEPMAYFTHGGVNYAMTATEAALFNQKTGGTLRSKMPSLTHKNLPLALYLETADLGYSPWTGSKVNKVTDTQILTYLGIGIISFVDAPVTEIEAPDVKYRTDTDVITSIIITTDTELNSENPASVTFHINGLNYTVNNIVIPEGGSQVVWAKWHTPSTPQKFTIDVSVTGAYSANTSFKAKIVDLSDNPPPNPEADDRDDDFTLTSPPSKAENTYATWGVYNCYWEPDWRWESNWNWTSYGHSSYCPPDCNIIHGYWEDNGRWKDFGEWVFEYTSYYASLISSMSLMPDDIVPTAEGKTMGSGYGVKADVLATLSTDAPSGHYTYMQNAVSYFPEFYYDDYWRLLERYNSGINAKFRFPENEYSTTFRNVHFTPIYYPDDTNYVVYTYALDLWTPSGMLSKNLTDYVIIKGSVFNDWYTSRD